MKKDKKIEEKINNWFFISCPTEEKEPFLWRWKKEGLKILVKYITEIAEEARRSAIQEFYDKIVEEWADMAEIRLETIKEIIKKLK